MTYTYNSDGIRTRKKVGSVTTNYTLEGDKVVYETNGTDKLWYYYDASGMPVSFELNGTSYHYVKNLQGDIIAIVNDSGAKVVEYKYDSWGKLISTTGSLASTVGIKNPYRYRGYRYDTETGLYYLQSRYYDPQIGRFINADDIISDAGKTNGYCLFVYCLNNPITYVDDAGHSSTFNKYIGGKYKSGSVTVFYWGNNSPQSMFGYCNTYDKLSWIIGCDISALTFYFKYNKKQWRIELWKGSYACGLMYGGEIGIYYSNNKTKGGLYTCATNTSLKLSFTLKNKRGKGLLFSTNARKTWWQTGFTWGRYHRNNIQMIATITFPEQEEMFKKQFYNSRNSGRLFRSREPFSCRLQGNSVIIVWG